MAEDQELDTPGEPPPAAAAPSRLLISDGSACNWRHPNAAFTRYIQGLITARRVAWDRFFGDDKSIIAAWLF